MSFDSSSSYFAGTSIARKRLERRRMLEKVNKEKEKEKTYFWKEVSIPPHLITTKVLMQERKKSGKPKKQYYTDSHERLEKYGSTISRPKTSHRSVKYQKTKRTNDFKYRMESAYKKTIESDRMKRERLKTREKIRARRSLSPLKKTVSRFDFSQQSVKSPGYVVNSSKRFRHKKQATKPNSHRLGMHKSLNEHPFYHYLYNISPQAPEFKEKHQRITVARHTNLHKKSKYKNHVY